MEKLDKEWFGADLKSRRRSKVQTLRVTAKEIGISTATLSRFENASEPDITNYFKCCKWLGVNMEKYFAPEVPAGGFRSPKNKRP